MSMLSWLRKRFNPHQSRDARGRWSPAGGLATRVIVRGKGTTAAWKERVGMTPKAYFDELLNGTGLHVSLVRVYSTGDGVRYDAALATPDQKHAGWLEREFRDNDSGEPIVYHKIMQLEKVLQGKGVAKQLIRNSMAQYTRAGLAEIHTHAALTGGGAVWPKFGFLPSSKGEWTLLRRRIRPRLEKLPHFMRDAYAKLLASDDPKVLWLIADSVHGRTLLHRTAYHAVLNLGDAKQMRRLRAYIRP